MTAMLVQDWIVIVEKELLEAGFQVSTFEGFPWVKPAPGLRAINLLISIQLSVPNRIVPINGGIAFLPACEVQCVLEGVMARNIP
jgi:hypothetical protein